MIDRELVTRKIVLIVRDLDALRPVAANDRQAYLTSLTDQVLAERYLERIIGRLIDINDHLLTDLGQPPPADYQSSFTRLAGIRVLDADFAARIAVCAGLRNRLVHEYNETDHGKVVDALHRAIDDIPRYLRGIDEFIASRSA